MSDRDKDWSLSIEILPIGTSLTLPVKAGGFIHHKATKEYLLVKRNSFPNDTVLIPLKTIKRFIRSGETSALIKDITE